MVLSRKTKIVDVVEVGLKVDELRRQITLGLERLGEMSVVGALDWELARLYRMQLEKLRDELAQEGVEEPDIKHIVQRLHEIAWQVLLGS